MFQGTGSDVGKTVLVAGFCRAALKRGIRVAPFKPQNMSNNAAVAKGMDGAQGEIGRGQWLQAMACGMEPNVHMNPILLKPQSQIGSQVVVQGQVWGNAKARQYQSMKGELLSKVMESFKAISGQADLILVEGAGSPAEVNLRAGDIANMGFATHADVPVILVGDIDRGGVIASIVGTKAILDEKDNAQIAGYLINKFRGDVTLFDDGLEIISKHTAWPCFGVLPWVDAASRLPAEDSVALDRLISQDTAEADKVVAVPVLGRIANFDDLDPLMGEPGISVRFIKSNDPFPNADLIVLPGSKATISDLQELKERGWDKQICAHAHGGKPIIGICGGYQMLGQRVSDPVGLEGKPKEINGLGLLEISTQLRPVKTVRTSKARSMEYSHLLEGYEIHMGETSGVDCVRPMIEIEGHGDGAINPQGNVRGCYLHGLFGNNAYRRSLLRELDVEASSGTYEGQVETALDDLAHEIERCLDVDAILATATEFSGS